MCGGARIQERVKVGLERARPKGKTLGSPRTDHRTEAKIRELAARGTEKGKSFADSCVNEQTALRAPCLTTCSGLLFVG